MRQSPAEKAMMIWDGVWVERDIHKLYKCKKREDAIDCLWEFVDQLNFNDDPDLDKLTKEERESYISSVKSDVIHSGLSDWELELEEGD